MKSIIRHTVCALALATLSFAQVTTATLTGIVTGSLGRRDLGCKYHYHPYADQCVQCPDSRGDG